MQKKILVADDAIFMRAMLKNILIPQKYTVIEAANGQEALDRYRAEKPDLVLMDIIMPVMDGMTAVRAIKEEDPDACLVMCTAAGHQANVIEATQAGAKDFIVKPFRVERVIECVERLIG